MVIPVEVTPRTSQTMETAEEAEKRDRQKALEAAYAELGILHLPERRPRNRAEPSLEEEQEDDISSELDDRLEAEFASRLKQWHQEEAERANTKGYLKNTKAAVTKKAAQSAPVTAATRNRIASKASSAVQENKFKDAWDALS
ncbi:hypothetical protein CYMTET_50734 [Cymbomonas tetramitiformis]|uniref:Uncharacterized protein n=1 Tax=Cymbomonas tetramitiformis TaxID=36881 RepID=A0AAE0ETE2_9CHLO|nr:hypothetical protein CYMTET_50734 [Cymbomonas tetramitiformis]